jgi:release factor glutamine methyltransferase
MTTQRTTWTVLNILNATSDYFNKHQFENPRLNAERLLSYVLKIDRVQLYLQFERILSTEEVQSYRNLVKRRTEHEPLQHITGQTEFMGLPFFVNRDVLIPRPETEILVEQTLMLKNEFAGEKAKIWDIGTGSGCVAVSLAHFWPECHVLASDISEAAMHMAQKNSTLNKIDRIEFKILDILNDQDIPEESFDIIVSNPPYIGIDETHNLPQEVIEFEPLVALTDNADGLTFYRRIIELISKIKDCKFILLEMSGTQTENILQLFRSQNCEDIQIINDLNNIPRILKIYL